MVTRLPDVNALALRVEQLEKQNRRLRAVSTAILVAIAGSLVMGQAAPASDKALQAQEFILRDGQGQLRAKLYLDQGEPALVLFDARLAERPRSTMAVHPDALAIERVKLGIMGVISYLTLRGSDGMMRATLTVSDEGSRLGLEDGKQKGEADIFVTAKTGSAISLTDGNGFISARLDATTEGPYIKLHAKDGKVLFSAP